MNSKGSRPQLSLLANDPVGSPPLFDGLRPAPQRRRSRTSSTSSSTSSSSGSQSLSPSPFHRPLPYAVPFSWERCPGIPKTPISSTAAASAARNLDLVLPLPPPIRSAGGLYRKKRLDGGADPFAAALAECAKDAPLATVDDLNAIWWRRAGKRSAGIWRRSTVADRLDVLGLSYSCKMSCSVSDATIVVPRSNLRAAGSYSLLNRRSE